MKETVIVVGDERKELSPLHTLFSNVYFTNDERALSTHIATALDEKTSFISLIDGSVIDNNFPFAKISKAISESNVGILHLGIRSRNENVELPNLSPDELITFIRSTRAIPSIFSRVTSEIAHGALEESCSTLNSLIVNCFLVAVSKGETVQSIDGAFYEVPSMPTSSVVTDPSIQSALKIALSLNNIEDLFPNHPWTTHEEESAAACYHTLAALFLNHNGIEAAIECIARSETLEESPRALALKGIIAHRQGAVLSAIANMVSSLQQYEARKKLDNSHYLSFNPKDMADVNKRLSEGLEALNKRDNSKALNHFASAVWNFDTFFEDFGFELPSESL